jgi:hypothetical protein
MDKKLGQCVACGSQDITRFEKETMTSLTLGSEFSFKEIFYVCNSCKEEGDFFEETDKNYLIAQKDAQVAFVKKVLDSMSKSDITMAMFERVFELPLRTLTRWKGGDFSSSALALLRILATYPWIIDAAEHGFEKNYSRGVLISAAAQELKKESNIDTAIPRTEVISNAYFLVKVSPSQTESRIHNFSISAGAT